MIASHVLDQQHIIFMDFHEIYDTLALYLLGITRLGQLPQHLWSFTSSSLVAVSLFFLDISLSSQHRFFLVDFISGTLGSRTNPLSLTISLH